MACLKRRGKKITTSLRYKFPYFLVQSVKCMQRQNVGSSCDIFEWQTISELSEAFSCLLKIIQKIIFYSHKYVNKMIFIGLFSSCFLHVLYYGTFFFHPVISLYEMCLQNQQCRLLQAASERTRSGAIANQISGLRHQGGLKCFRK